MTTNPALLPPARPKQSEEETREILRRYGVTDAVAIVGVRGYYRDTMGAPGKNDRNLYDDAVFVVSPNAYAAFNANTDPSIFRRGIATLRIGVHRYRKGRHGISRKPPYVPYAALRPATAGERLPVSRDGQTTAAHGTALNVHKGGINSTNSEGCQTIPPSQYDAFIKLVYAEMDRAGQKTIPYVLIENQG